MVAKAQPGPGTVPTVEVMGPEPSVKPVGVSKEELVTLGTRAWNAVYARAEQAVDWLGKRIRDGARWIWFALVKVFDFAKEAAIRVASCGWELAKVAIHAAINLARLAIELSQSVLSGILRALSILLDGVKEEKAAA